MILSVRFAFEDSFSIIFAICRCASLNLTSSPNVSRCIQKAKEDLSDGVRLRI